jgi:hypothetical protein
LVESVARRTRPWRTRLEARLKGRLNQQRKPPGLSFQEFLRGKAEAFGVRDRHRRRSEWLDAIRRLFEEIRGWLRESDPEGLLDVEMYEVARTEPDLGTYEAPALKIHLGAVEVDVVPVSRKAPWTPIKGAVSEPSELLGRVDITDGFRKHNVYRETRGGKESWQIRDDHNQLMPLDRRRFEQILQDLLA